MTGSDLGTGWGPYPGQQTKFFTAAEDEVFGGGAGGGGKSMLGMMKYCQQLVVEHQRFKKGQIKRSRARGFFGRRKTTDLEQMIEESHEYFPEFDSKADYNGKTTTWIFPSCGNATFQFDHMQHVKDRFRYKSSAFCMAGGERVVMGDGSSRKIEDIRAGDRVMTAEGQRVVVASWKTGIKPCVRVTTRFQGATVGMQVHPTTHPVLRWTSAGSPLSPSPDSHGTDDLGNPLALAWQDFESLLDGALVTGAVRASSITEDGVFVGSHGKRRELQRPATWYVPVALHGPTVRRSLSMGSNESAASPEPSERLHPEIGPPLLTSSLSVEQWRAAFGSVPAGTETLLASCGALYARTDSGTRSDSPDHYSSSPGPRDERAPETVGGAQGSPRQPDDAAGHIPTETSPDGRGQIRGDIRNTGPSYPHFYSGERRPLTEELLQGEAKIEFAGWFETFDLTVAEANQYVSVSGLFNCQTYVFFDELTEFEEIQYLYMKSRIRSKDPVLSKMLQIVSGSNPDGPGLLWVRDRFIEGKEPETVYRTVHTLEDGRTKELDSVFIPFRLKDNPALYESGQYELQLRGLPPEIQEAILNGNWYYASGAYLARAWDSRYHVCPNHAVPGGANITRSMDYGYSKPGSCTWWYLDRDGVLTAFYNLYLTEHTPEMWALRIREVEEEFDLWDAENNVSRISGPLDSACWDKANSKTTIYQRMFEKGVRFFKARKGPGSRLNSAVELISRLKARVRDPLFPDDRLKDKPLIRWMERCGAPIRTLPVLRPDPNNAEDVDTSGEDHCYDEARYECASKPLVPEKEKDADEDDVDNVVDIKSGNRRVGVGSWASS